MASHMQPLVEPHFIYVSKRDSSCEKTDVMK